jgi:hypothetical protein
MTSEDYCPFLNKCGEARREFCYDAGYKNCVYYEANKTIQQNQPPKEKGLVRKLAERLGNPQDRSLQL